MSDSLPAAARRRPLTRIKALIALTNPPRRQAPSLTALDKT